MKLMTGPGIDAEEDMWPGPTYGYCTNCGEQLNTYYNELCNECRREPFSIKQKGTTMPPMSGSFDANQFAPKQIGESHPVGKFPFNITRTECVPTKDNTGGMFNVEFTTPVGSILMRYNLWNQNPKAVEIAHGQLSALCHATGIFRLDWTNEGAALRGGKGMIDVGYQKGQEPSAENPHGGYTEVKKVYDANGNEPGKGPASAPQPQGQAQPQAGQSGGGWGQPANQQATQGQGGWGNQGQANPAANGMQPAAQQQPQNNTQGGWSQGPSGQQSEAPPWKR